nr:hypothetical protein [Tanacetum cinerariifolium]
MANITKTSTLPSDSSPRVTSFAADEGSMQQKLNELTALYAPIKERSLDEGEEAAEKGSDDTEEMVIVLTSLDAATILSSGVLVSISPVTKVYVAEVPTGSGSIPTASPPGTGVPTGGVPTGSDVVPTASPIFTTATVATPYTKRKAEELQIMIDGLDMNNETVAKYLQEYYHFAEDLPFGERIELIKESERFKRKGIRLEQDSAKKVKTLEEVPEEKLKEIMQLIPVEEALVKETLNIRPAANDKEKELWVELKRLYEPNVEDQLWTHTKNLMHAPVEWKLYDTCGVHHVISKDQEMFMLAEKDYPLKKVMKFPLPEYFPTASEERIPLLSQRDATAKEVCTAEKLKHTQKRDMEKVIRLQIMMDESYFGGREMIFFVQNLNDEMLEMADTFKNRAEYIEELERYPRLRANVESVKTARVLKHTQKRDMEKVIRLQIMMDQSYFGGREMIFFVQKLNDEMLG